MIYSQIRLIISNELFNFVSSNKKDKQLTYFYVRAPKD